LNLLIPELQRDFEKDGKHDYVVFQLLVNKINSPEKATLCFSALKRILLEIITIV
jgi:hypothetical protein